MRKLGILARDSCSLDLERVLRRLRFLAAARDPLEALALGVGQPPARRAEVVAHHRCVARADERDRVAVAEHPVDRDLRDRAPAGTLLRVLVGAWQEGATCD